MSLPFPSDRTFDRSARVEAPVHPSSPEHLLAADVPVDSSEGAGPPIPILPASSEAPTVDETGEEVVLHENDETLAALADEGATEILRAVQDEVWGSPVDANLEQIRGRA